MERHIGIYPGTFDPVHAGHIAFATQAMRECKLDEIYFLPEPRPRNKPNAGEIGERARLLEYELAKSAGLRVFCPLSEQYTTKETLPELSNEFENTKFTMLVGSDVFKNIADWNDVEILLGGIDIAVGLRGHDTADDIHAIAQKTKKKLGIEMNYKIIHTPKTRHISSSQVRNKHS